MLAIKELKTTQNASELHSFLGLTVYASGWKPNLATLTKPLWKLTHAKSQWSWSDGIQSIFDTVKASIIETVGYFDTRWVTNIHSDASSVGLSGVLTQHNPKDIKEKKIIMCISRMLCMACQATERSGAAIMPLALKQMPEAPWENISVDYFGPIAPTKEYLFVIMDDYSRFPLVENAYSTAAATLINILENILSIFGIPEEVTSDNGPPFDSLDFKNFSHHIGFCHRKIKPKWPQANGIAESFMKNLDKVLRTAEIS